MFLHRKHVLAWLGFVLGSIALGFWVMREVPVVIDDYERYSFSLWLLSKYGLHDFQALTKLPEHVFFYAPLWDFILGIFTEYVFAFLGDPYWVRHGLTFALLPISLGATYVLLRKCGESAATSVLAVCFILGIIRFGGHTFHTKDFPPAASFIPVTLALYLLLQNIYKKMCQGVVPVTLIIGATFVSMIPFLVRMPLALHTVVLCGCVAFLAFKQPKYSVKQAVVTALLPVITAVVMCYVLFPVVWGKGPFEIIELMKFFTEFSPGKNWHGNYFYTRYMANELPWWYAIGFIPVIVQPVALLGLLFGICLLGIQVWPRMRSPQTWLRPSPRCWFVAITALAWLAVIVLRPTLYSDERHIIFLYAPLMVIAAFGFSILANRHVYICAAIAFCSSVNLYTQWGMYAFLYINPLLGIDGRGFYYDDFRVCFSDLMNQLQKQESTHQNITVVSSSKVTPIMNTLREQQKRNEHALLRKGKYQPVQLHSRASPYDKSAPYFYLKRGIEYPASQEHEPPYLGIVIPSGHEICRAVPKNFE